MIYIIILLILFVFTIIYGIYKKAEIQFSPVLGFMFGALISYDDLYGDTEYTIQVCFGFISLTIIWTQDTNG